MALNAVALSISLSTLMRTLELMKAPVQISGVAKVENPHLVGLGAHKKTQ